VALTSLLIACHTFAVLFFRWQPPKTRKFPLGVVSVIGLFLLLATLIPALTLPDFWDISGDWCWISPMYPKMWLGLEYAIFWTVALGSFLLYIPLFLCLRGNIVVEYPHADEDGWGRGKLRISWRWVQSGKAWRRSNAERKEQMDVARQMLAYPIAYTFMILPSSIIRGIEMHDKTLVIPAAAVAFSGAVYACSGLVNVSLYVITRPAVFDFLLQVVWNRRSVPDVQEEVEAGAQDGYGIPLGSSDTGAETSDCHGGRKEKKEPPPVKIPEMRLADDDISIIAPSEYSV